MLNFVQIKDFVTNETYQIVLNGEDFDELDDVWEEDNDDLIKYGKNELFYGRTSYSSLMPLHFQILISSHIENLTGIDLDDREKALFDDDDEFYKKLKLLLMGFIRSIINYTTSYIDLVNLEILSDHKINFSVNMAMSIETMKREDVQPKPIQKGNLKIVVDNTK